LDSCRQFWYDLRVFSASRSRRLPQRSSMCYFMSWKARRYLINFVHHQCALLGDDVYRDLPDHDEVFRRVCSARYGRTNPGGLVYARQTSTKNVLLVSSKKTTKMTIRSPRRPSLGLTCVSQFGAAISDAICVGSFPTVREPLRFKLAYVYKTMAVTDMWWLALALFLICIAEVRYYPTCS
jgi:hypothetical protein